MKLFSKDTIKLNGEDVTMLSGAGVETIVTGLLVAGVWQTGKWVAGGVRMLRGKKAANSNKKRRAKRKAA